jgi:hypothetical protein
LGSSPFSSFCNPIPLFDLFLLSFAGKSAECSALQAGMKADNIKS